MEFLAGTRLGNSSVPTAIRIGVMRDALHTQFPITNSIESGFEGVTTGSSHKLPGGGTVIIVGRPYFRSRDLKDLAGKQGIAAALAAGYAEYSQDIFKHTVRLILLRHR